jgi:multidrug efflux pump subunit AcrA (membrane-fusion protein)
VQKNTLQVKVAIEDPSPEIKPEMLARARFIAVADEAGQVDNASTSQRLFVPAAALLERDGQRYVWLADQVENVARLRPVTAGRAGPDGWTAVSDGLQPGDRVIVDAPPTLADGQRIRITGD